MTHNNQRGPNLPMVLGDLVEKYLGTFPYIYTFPYTKEDQVVTVPRYDSSRLFIRDGSLLQCPQRLKRLCILFVMWPQLPPSFIGNLLRNHKLLSILIRSHGS